VAGKEFFVNSMSPSAEEAQTSVAMLALKTLTEGNFPISFTHRFIESAVQMSLFVAFKLRFNQP
jgi:hypothetical protein